MAFITQVSLDHVRDAAEMARCLRAILMSVCEPSQTEFFADDDEEPDRPIRPRERSFIVGSSGSSGFRIMVSDPDLEKSFIPARERMMFTTEEGRATILAEDAPAAAEPETIPAEAAADA